MSALDDLKNKDIGLLTSLDIVVLSEPNFGLQGASAAELVKLKSAWKVSKELMQALYDARSDLPRTATLAFNWLKNYGDLYPEEKRDE